MGSKNDSRRHRLMGREVVLMRLTKRELKMDIVLMHRPKRKGTSAVSRVIFFTMQYAISCKSMHLGEANRSPSNISLHAQPQNIFNKNNHSISKNMPSFNPKMTSPQQTLVQ